MTRSFQAGFRWGGATAAYQIEGAAAEDGRGPSIWDTFSHTPGNVLHGDTGDEACDHYHRFADDVALLGKIGLTDYRFSIAWSRVIPSGSGPVNETRLDFYSRLVDELLARDIRPVATLYHWDLPQPLSEVGGWTNRDTSQRFADYASVVAERLGDRVATSTTLNEPWCSAYLGYATGHHAPGVCDRASAFKAVHHLLLAHGLGVQALRAAVPSQVEVSITLNPPVVRPAGDGAEDLAAAERADLIADRAFHDPLRRSCLPDGLIAATVADESRERAETPPVGARDGDRAGAGAGADRARRSVDRLHAADSGGRGVRAGRAGAFARCLDRGRADGSAARSANRCGQPHARPVQRSVRSAAASRRAERVLLGLVVSSPTDGDRVKPYVRAGHDSDCRGSRLS